MAHRRPGRAYVQWLWLKFDFPASPFIRFSLGSLILLLGLGAFFQLGQPVLLALLQ